MVEYEKDVSHFTASRKAIALCTYPLEKCGALEVIGAVSSHKYVVIEREGELSLIESFERKKTEDALQKAYDKLETRGKKKSADLRRSSRALRSETKEHKLAEEKILEQAALLDKAQDAVAVRDLENRLTYWNKGAERIYGWTAEEVIGRNADYLVYHKPSTTANAKKSVVEKGEWTGELHQVTKDGGEIIVESRWTLVRDDDEGKPKSILIINTDITERKRLEAQLLRAQRTESIGMLANGLAHDLNNILAPITISLEMLREEVKTDEGQRTIDLLEKSAERGAGLVKQVQSFALGVEGERKALQVEDIISEVEQIAKETFPRNIEIRAQTAKNLSNILGDSTQLHQVLINLCVNARDAMMPDGGNLTISAENFHIDENYARMNIEAKIGQYIVITVSDTGAGIAPEIMDKIFDPFFTTKEFGTGTGLGLPTALAIVKSHGGFINVYSEEGKGSAFKVYLPALKTNAKQKVKEGGEEEPEAPAGHGETVLVVEDESSIREITKSTLEKHGYKVLTASDGAEAIAVYTQNRSKVKVILMDLMMPTMDGETSIKALRKIDPAVKIIVVSGLIRKDRYWSITNSHKIQASMSKPYTASKLLTTIYKTLNSDNTVVS